MPEYADVERAIDEVEAELKHLGRWQKTPLPDTAFENMGPFGMNTMTPEQWLQFVLIPSVRRIIQSKGRFPASSQVAIWAVRNFDGDHDVQKLCSLLSDFDRLFSS